MKKHNVNNRERERNGGRGERERERERTGATQHAPDTRECKGEESAERRWGRASRKTSGFAARSGLVAAVASERVRMEKGAATK